MKITLNIPDTTIGAFFDFVYYAGSCIAMQNRSILSDEIYDGAEITIEQEVEG